MNEFTKQKLWAGFGTGLLLSLSVAVTAAVAPAAPTGTFFLMLDEHIRAVEETRFVYLLSGEPADLDLYEAAVRSLTEDLPTLRRTRKLRRIESLIRRRLSLMDARVRLRREKGFSEAFKDYRKVVGKEEMEDVRLMIRGIMAEV